MPLEELRQAEVDRGMLTGALHLSFEHNASTFGISASGELDQRDLCCSTAQCKYYGQH
jgi:hypothetical protein